MTIGNKEKNIYEGKKKKKRNLYNLLEAKLIIYCRYTATEPPAQPVRTLRSVSNKDFYSGSPSRGRFSDNAPGFIHFYDFARFQLTTTQKLKNKPR